MEAIDPVDGKRMTVLLSQVKLQAVGRRSKGQIREAAYLVPAVLQEPKAIFEGLLRESDESPGSGAEGWRCYCGIPDKVYNQDGSQRKPWDGEVFLVFVNADKEAYNWYWYECDPENRNLPQGHSERFRKRLL